MPPRERQQVEIWRGKRIEEMTREEAIKALKDCATAYRDHLNDDKEVWERWQRWDIPHAKASGSRSDSSLIAARRRTRYPWSSTATSPQESLGILGGGLSGSLS